MSRTQHSFAPPVMEARRWLTGLTFTDDHRLINLSQAAPIDPPPAPMRAHMAELIETQPDTHLYGDVLGLRELRDRLAEKVATTYCGPVAGDNIAITSGCNQAFTATLAALCDEGDEIIIPTPYYFNHQMACAMGGANLVPLPVGQDMLPDPDHAASLITPRTRALLMISPNNPTGAEYPPSLIRAFFELARKHGLKLIIDETYRDFHSQDGAPHDLFTDPDWADTLIQLYSFSKSFRLTGHRVGAITADADWLSEVEKYLDTVTICPVQLGQHAALWGLNNLDAWLAEQRAEILARRDAMTAAIQNMPGWRLMGCGAYFAYAQTPEGTTSPELAKQLVREAAVLLLPGTMFRPDSDPSGAREMRIAFANEDADGIALFAQRIQDHAT